MNNKMGMDSASGNQPESEQDGTSSLLKKPLSRRSVLGAGAGLLVVGAGAGALINLQRGLTHAATPPPPKPKPTPAPKPTPPPPPGSGSNAVIQWNNTALQAIRDVSPGPTIGSRALAIMHTCMYDAWATYDPKANPTRPNGIPRQKAPADVTQAVSYAAYRALMDLFPTEASLFNSVLQGQGFNPNNTSTDIKTQAGVGNVAAQAVISYRHNDGSNQINGYADTTGYVSVNTADTLVNPVRWQPLRVNGNDQKYTTPHWGTVKPFALTSSSQFRPAGPVIDTTSSAYKSQVDQIIQYSAQLNDQTKTVADYWANGPHSETPPGHWMLFTQFFCAQFISTRDKHALQNDVQLFFAMSNAVFDAGIACWECKRFYDYARPITAVRFLYAGQQITAWGGYNQGTATMDGSQWIPYQEAIVVTPPFPEYVSGHSTFSAASAYILKALNGDIFGSSYTEAALSSVIEPGFAPSQNVTLSWPTFTAAADEAGISRRYGGIHFQQGDLDGRTLGSQVGQVAGTKALGFIQGTIKPGA